MPRPEGTLTGPQKEIMEVVWSHGREGATVAAIWEQVSKGKDVARTTVLTLVQRLERRGWLVVDKSDKAHRYHAARAKGHTAGRLAAEFVDAFFGGSASSLVESLLGSNKIKRQEIDRLRELLAQDHAKE